MFRSSDAGELRPLYGIDEKSGRNPTSPLALPEDNAESALRSQRTSVSRMTGDVVAALRSGSRESLDQLVPLLYAELRVIAHRQLAGQLRGGTLDTSALVHEAYLKVVNQSGAGASDRAHVLALTSLAMRHVLVDRARAQATLKRGETIGRITLDEEHIAVDEQPEALLRLDDAMVELAELEPRLARVVECRFFGGLTEEEIAEALGVTVRTVQRDWAKARMLLRRTLAS
ncbi:MAG: ECF-type sigma factor [Gemmatimonadaceae bacterium]